MVDVCIAAALGDTQVNAENVTYAINYISAISQNKNISIITWSQSGLITQWAFKCWPSTRKVVSDFIPISPDFHGTVSAYALCPGFRKLPCDPAIIQQEYSSKFVQTLREGGGDSAYVPTTTLYSIYDEIVQPTSGTDASAYLKSSGFAQASNNEVQSLCPGRPAGGFYTHEGVLYNPISFALIRDALTHDGPGDSSRIDLATLCDLVAADGLSLNDVLATEGLIPLAVVNGCIVRAEDFRGTGTQKLCTIGDVYAVEQGEAIGGEAAQLPSATT
ncbi:alpha/beta-hydrolase [Saitoella complicata NRRL Y-17804]|uniref:Uncharacterized protein n=1 Tax=Saitoella complicata (strain BCRC 22490 / CBS 7301 / JCM 7358 / NBRC 10748 / NRRL Y-17804) TaxID=698492 RepID=A0A0E9NCE8_SAICN|nr:alpha/beta-hydrolase [Saitoella complicata NRRL Y-17804]ODQ52594.1 alpha/beta-hydrolase [Saitoella complicata NRRL Y-17804]GAO47542.1 hypothetical protein G7K_1747-t1 [Saitoella complicata NRRL Y-17804]